jgi:hypothetical protein
MNLLTLFDTFFVLFGESLERLRHAGTWIVQSEPEVRDTPLKCIPARRTLQKLDEGYNLLKTASIA